MNWLLWGLQTVPLLDLWFETVGFVMYTVGEIVLVIFTKAQEVHCKALFNAS